MATTSRTKLDLKTVQTPFYATVGVTDLAVGAVREYKAVPAKVATLVDDNVSALGDTYVDLVKRGESLVGRIRRQRSTQATVKSAETTVTKAKTTRTQATKSTKAATKAATKTAATGAKKVTKTAKKRSTAPRSSAKATATAAKKTASSATQAVTDAAQKVGD